MHLRPLGFKNIRLLAMTDREILEGQRSPRLSFMHIKEEEDYYEKRDRLAAERDARMMQAME